jgi:hypothetical protein
MPTWEREMLLRRHVEARQVQNGEGAAETIGEPLSSVPKEFT